MPFPLTPSLPSSLFLRPSLRRSPIPSKQRQFSTLKPPLGAWDSHVHVTDPANFPPAASATYAPHAALLPAAHANAFRLGVPNLVFVQPSTYGTDNSCLLDALRKLTPAYGRGVVVIDPANTTTEQLHEFHAQGVRGVRVNLKSVGENLGKEDLLEILATHADAIRPMRSWVLQLYADLGGVAALEGAVEKFGVKIVVDHLASPTEDLFDDAERANSEDWKAFMRFLGQEGAFVKVSGPYRLTADPQFRTLQGLVKEVLKVRGGEAGVWASDWPHTRFEGIDVEPWRQRCLEWCEEDEGLRDRLFRDNARALWDVDS